MGKEFRAVYVQKNGLFNSKRINIVLVLRDERITGNALRVSDFSGYVQESIDIEYCNIIEYSECDFENGKALRMKVCVQRHGTDMNDIYVFPLAAEYSISEIIVELTNIIDEYNAKVKIMEEERIKRQQEREEKHNAYLAELQAQYDSIYNFHIHESTPVYVFDKGNMNCFVVFIGEDKSFNFLFIDVQTNCEIHSVISYDEIHYYEKAGAVHYATTINADYSSGQLFGGSFVGGKVSTGMAALGGLLFGPMGMAIGAMSSYTPAKYTPPTYTPSKLNISSEVTKIDDRSIILNYYSQQHKQFVDIELPQEMFNFMQTFLPDKKYAIVIEKEKQAALGNSVNNLPATAEPAADTTIQRLQKLKSLFEMELISEEEYKERKREILAEI